MKRIAMPFLLALLSATMAAPGCSWFHENPVIPAVVTCSGKTIPLNLVTETYQDVMSENWIDLATKVVPLLQDGWADAACIMDYLATSNPETAPHIQALKASHVELRGGSASNDVYKKESPARRSHTGAAPGAMPLGSWATVAVPAIGCLNGTVLREQADGDWRCVSPDAVPTGPAMTLGASYQDCDSHCGSGNGLVVPGGCRCRVGIGLKSHWVAAR